MFDSDSSDNKKSVSNKKTFEQQFGWLVTLDNITNNQRWHYQFFQEMNVIEFLNHLAFLKSKKKERERQERIEKMRNGR